jgi:hypothetical protein
MFTKTSKINEFRLWGLLLTLIGMGLMIVGTSGLVLFGEKGRFLVYIFMFLGAIAMLGSVMVYFWAGVMSTNAVMLECPECGKPTKMLGKTDRCMFCKTILTFDPRYATASDTKTKQADPAQPDHSSTKEQPH